MSKYKIERWRLSPDEEVFHLYEKVGRWPLHKWERIHTALPSQEAAEEHVRRMTAPVCIETDYYDARGFKDYAW